MSDYIDVSIDFHRTSKEVDVKFHLDEFDDLHDMFNQVGMLIVGKNEKLEDNINGVMDEVGSYEIISTSYKYLGGNDSYMEYRFKCKKV